MLDHWRDGRACQGVPLRRLRGRPTSSNKASSFHLRWVGEPRELVEVSAVLTVLEPTPNSSLRFWALQASFEQAGRRFGAAHLGLQRHTGFPGDTAANWGGYAEGGGELVGEGPNTRAFVWDIARPYRLTIRRGDDGWAGFVDDHKLRELDVGGDRLAHVVVWSEIFARCDDPTHAVRWSDLRGIDAAGVEHEATALSVNYQRWADGGCTNTDSSLDETGGVVQRTGTERRTPQGALLPIRT